MIQRGKPLDLVIAPVAGDAAPKIRQRKNLHQLGENRPTDIQLPFLSRTWKEG